MHRLRRFHDVSVCSPVAAEVLESRSLLSAGAAAARAATQHAAALHDAAPIQPDTSLPGLALADRNGGIATAFAGHFTSAQVHTTIGGKVNVKFTGTFLKGNTTETLKVSFSGKVSAEHPGIGTADFTLEPTGGAFTATAKTPGEATKKAVGKIDPAEFHVFTTGTSFSEIKGTFDYSPRNPPPLDTGVLDVDIKVSG
jgi:hypothetical protein